MNLDEYQKQALKSISITQKDVAALAHRSLGLTGEAGIIANQLKKVIRDKNGTADDKDVKVLKKRLGDVMYYVAALADYFDLSLDDIAAQNLEQASSFLEDRKA